jgi:hypothetical protein
MTQSAVTEEPNMADYSDVAVDRYIFVNLVSVTIGVHFTNPVEQV